jgi:hypothetical protein
MTPGDKVWYSTAETAAELDLTVAYVQDLAARGLIESSQAVPKGRRRFRREWIDAYAENCRTRRLRPVS